MNSMFTTPNKTKAKEKNTLIARTAATSSVALTSIYEYHFQIWGTKKCQIPKPIRPKLPLNTKILTSRSKVTPQSFLILNLFTPVFSSQFVYQTPNRFKTCCSPIPSKLFCSLFSCRLTDFTNRRKTVLLSIH